MTFNKTLFETKTCQDGRDGWLIQELRDFCSLLFLPVSGSKKELCKRLNDYFYNLSTMSGYASVGDYVMVQSLIQKGADIHANNDYALRAAAENGHTDVVKLLLENGANLDAEYGYSLQSAAERGHTDVVKLLVDHGADINVALHAAAENGHTDVVKMLVENGANVHSENDYALRLAAKKGYLNIVKFLVDHGADIHAKNDYALQISGAKGYLNIVNFLVDHGANIHAQNNRAMILSAEDGQLHVLEFLVEKGADIHADNDFALMMSVKNGHLPIVRFLIEHGANVNASVNNESVLSWAVNNNDIAIYLIEHGADISNLPFHVLDSKIQAAIQKHRFKIGIRQVSNLIASSKNDNLYKWQDLCGVIGNKDRPELINLAKLQGISNSETMSKREICKQLAEKYEKKMLKKGDVSKCKNDTTLLGDAIELVPKPLLITLDNYCFNIIELIEMISKGKTKHPYTNMPLDNVKITTKYNKLKYILRKNKLTLVNILDEIKNNAIMTTESIRLLKGTNILAKLNYTISSTVFVDMIGRDENLNILNTLLNENALMKIKDAHDIDTMLDEITRLLNIEDSHTETRKAALEVYINTVYSSGNIQ